MSITALFALSALVVALALTNVVQAYRVTWLGDRVGRLESEVERLHRDLIAARLLGGVVVPPDFPDEEEGLR